MQHVLFVTSTNDQSQNIWTGSNVWNCQSIGPVPLIRVSDMLGYEADNRPSPSQRVEQNLGSTLHSKCVAHVIFVF